MNEERIKELENILIPPLEVLIKAAQERRSFAVECHQEVKGELEVVKKNNRERERGYEVEIQVALALLNDREKELQLIYVQLNPLAAELHK